jgi:hypothetical protein
MLCSLCATKMDAAIYTFAAYTLSGRTLCANVCRPCVLDMFTRPVVRKLDRLLDTSGWQQVVMPGMDDERVALALRPRDK